MDKRTHFKNNIGTGIALSTAFLAAGWLLMSWVEGWGGIVLWILVALPLCVVVEFALRRREIQKRPTRSILKTTALRVNVAGVGGKSDRDRKAPYGMKPAPHAPHPQPPRPPSQRL